MAFLFPKSLQVIQMLQFGRSETQEQELAIEVGEKQLHDPSLTKFVHQATPLQCWSTDDVRNWLQQNVPLEEERMEECLSAFQNEGIDGLRLLSLQRSSLACTAMTDSEWLLLHAARESLIACEGPVQTISENPGSLLSPSTPKSCSEVHFEDDTLSLCEPSRLEKSLTLGPAHSSGSPLSYLKFLSLPRLWWSTSASKLDQKEPTMAEVYSLQEEVLSAEEREASLKAKMDHLDEILRTARLANYLYTRIRWTPLPGELPVDDVDVDDWLQRFLVLEGSTLFFYPRAADFRPQGAILLKEVVDIVSTSGQLRDEQEKITWFGFRVATRKGLCLECATPLKLQAELWMSSLQDAHAEQHPEDVNNGDLLDGQVL